MGQGAHLRNYLLVPECEVVALAEVKQELARKVAARWGIAHVYASHAEMLAKEQLDGIVASQPFTRHGTLIPELLQAGKPVFTEKPIAGSVEMGEKIVAATQANHTWMMIGYHKRSDPATMYAKAEINRLKQSGELGKLRYIRILMPAGDWVANGFNQNLGSTDPNPALQWDAPAKDMDKATNDAYTGFVNYYIHQVNLMRHLLGETWQATYADKAGVLLAGESASGVTCTIEMSPYQTTIDWQESALVCFERGWVKLSLPAPLAFTRPGQVEIFRDPGKGVTPKTEIPQLPWVHAMWQQATNFVAAVAGKQPTMCSAEDALADIQLAREYIRLKTGK
ncbi:MAG: Inositol 2-dehydrogenase/D-chiro-inositol 3-dehydrogenase [Verrucomicrobiae bacterium]|nr:Inositol 2-dehydrogenase/D-chiro-inositol 3-dehydrogenase [Verrucomicrobiae bacterium]